MKKIIMLFLIGVCLFSMACVSTNSLNKTLKPSSYTTEEDCVNAGFYWCDDDNDDVYACQKNECIGLGSLSDLPDTEEELTSDEALSDLDTSVNDIGLGELGDLGLNIFNGTDVTGGLI